jgi:hypothetical protein
MGELITQWGEDGLPDGQPKTTYYNRHGKAMVLPADPYSLNHYLGQGLRLKPPESLTPVEGDFGRRDTNSEGPISATRQEGAATDPGTTTQTIERLEGLLEKALAALDARDNVASVEPKRKRGPDRKKRKKSKRNRA